MCIVSDNYICLDIKVFVHGVVADTVASFIVFNTKQKHLDEEENS